LRRSSARRLLLALAALVVLGGAVVGGVVLERTVLDDDPAGISDAEHDRLIDACVGATGEDAARAPCTSWLADIVEVAEAEGVDYTRLAEYTNAMLQAFDGLENTAAIDARMRQTCDDYNAMPHRLCAAFRS
jgi:hypothetical protein